jgi:hypothetical protein
MNMPSDYAKLHAAPRLQRPYLVAAWSGMGAVAILSVNYLRKALGSQDLGEIDPYRFFSPSQATIKNHLLQTPKFPESRFYFCKTGTTHDLIFFVGTDQPSQGYEMAILILDTIEQFGVEKIYTAAAFPTLIHHRHDPGVWGTATHQELLAEMEAYGVQIMDEGTIGGLNGLLLAAAKDRGLSGLCLLGEIPLYATQTINPKAARAVLTVLTSMLDVEVDLAKLGLWAEDLAPQMNKLYDLLPDRVKEALERPREARPSRAPSALETGPDLVVDEELFDDIERFLDQHWRRKRDDEDEDESQPA